MRVFISHISEENDIATALRDWIQLVCKSRCEVFVSSDIPLGKEWLNEVKRALNSTKLLLVLCSPRSIERPWITFESGCGWIKGLDVIPICHSGQKKSQLPKPISQFQAIEEKDKKFPRALRDTLAQYGALKKMSRRLSADLRRKLRHAKRKAQERTRLMWAIQMLPEWDNKVLLKALKDAPEESEVRILQTWFPDIEQVCPMLERLLTYDKKRFRFKVLLLDKGAPKARNDLLDARIRYRAEDRREARHNIKHTAARLVKMKDRVDAEWRKTDFGKLALEIRAYNFMPFGPICQIGNSAMFIGFYPNYDSSINAPMVIIRDPKSEMWEKFEKNFQVGWDSTNKIVFPPRHKKLGPVKESSDGQHTSHFLQFSKAKPGKKSGSGASSGALASTESR